MPNGRKGSQRRYEIRMLREFMYFWGPLLECKFCHKQLVPDPNVGFGHRRHPAVQVRLTVHHEDRNRMNNDRKNLSWAHTECHRRFHATERAAAG